MDEPIPEMKILYMLQARPRSLSNLTHPATGVNYDHSMIAAQYGDTGLSATKSAAGRRLLEAARNDHIKEWPVRTYKFRIHRIDLDAEVPAESEVAAT